MPIFHFQHFSVRQQKSSMKICTDSLLFGAMAPIPTGGTVLEIGAGNGFLALMATQLGAGKITAIEIEPDAYRELTHNFRESPWAGQLTAVNQDIRCFYQTDDNQYDLIICNPPFFDKHLKPANAKRMLARHTDALPYADLIDVADKLLSPHGIFYILLPGFAVEHFCRLALDKALHPVKQVNFKGFAGKSAKVSALSFSRTESLCSMENLIVYQADGNYTNASSHYLQDFLLRFAKTQSLLN